MLLAKHTRIIDMQDPANTITAGRMLDQECMRHPLYPVFMRAIKQAMYGKGERHGGARTPFMEQPWVHYHAMHGRGFLTGQAAKKLEEAASTKWGESFHTEVLGAIVYAGMSVLMEEIKDSTISDAPITETLSKIGELS
jgi:hypothetical protein